MPKRYYTLHPPGCGWNLRANLIVVCILKLSYALGVPIPPHACTSGPPVSRMGPPTVTLQQGIPVPAAVPALEARRLQNNVFRDKFRQGFRRRGYKFLQVEFSCLGN